MYLDGFGYSKIADALNERKLPTPSGAKGVISHTQKWNNIAVQRILTNRVYLGDTVQGVSEKVSFKSKKTRRLPSDKWVITSNTHEAIIDNKTFSEAEILRNNKKSRFSCTDKGTINTYRGMVFCGHCNSPMFARKRSSNNGYICREYALNGKEACSSHFVREMDLNNIIAAELKLMLVDKEFIKALDSRLMSALNNTGREDTEFILMKNLNIIRHKQEKMYSDMLEGLISKDLFIRMNNALEENIRRVTAEIKSITAPPLEEYASGKLLEEIVGLCEKKRLTYQLASQLIKKITIFNEGECLQSFRTGENTQMENFNGIIQVEFNF